MPKPATPILLSRDEFQQLNAMRRKPKAQARYVQRGQIILRAAEGLGLRRINHSVEVIDTPANRGMINKVSYLVKVGT